MKINKNHFVSAELISDKSNGMEINISDDFMFVEPLRDLTEVDYWQNRLTSLGVSFILAKVGYRDRVDNRRYSKVVVGYSFFVPQEEWQKVNSL